TDGVIAQMIYMLMGGAPLGFFYKAVNTLDSMVGYHNDRYEYLGKCSAKADDIFNWIPARLAAICMIAAAGMLGLDNQNALRIFRRDRYHHKSPNSAQTESVCAGALHIQLAGDAVYFGKYMEKPFIGDPDRRIDRNDIARAERLMTGASLIMLALGIGIRLLFG
ncbi:MAG: cobalamin biosynthesis protein, partial [Butyricicoccus sp.]